MSTMMMVMVWYVRHMGGDDGASHTTSRASGSDDRLIAFTRVTSSWGIAHNQHSKRFGLFDSFLTTTHQQLRTLCTTS